MLSCPNCKTKIVQGDKFCRECGNNLNIIRTENVCAGPDEQCRESFMEYGMMGLFPMEESGYMTQYLKERARLEAEEAEQEKTAREAGCYKVIYQNYGAVEVRSEKKFYAPGDNVEVVYIGIISDAQYDFKVTVEDFNVRYDEQDNCRITFVMPDHDVEVLCSYELNRMR